MNGRENYFITSSLLNNPLEIPELFEPEYIERLKKSVPPVDKEYEAQRKAKLIEELKSMDAENIFILQKPLNEMTYDELFALYGELRDRAINLTQEF